MLGEALHRVFEDTHELKCTDIDLNTNWLEYCDFRDFAAYEKSVAEFEPDILMHIGAHTDLEYCENNPDDAYRTNTLSVEHASVLARTHPRFHTPHVATILTGVFVAVAAAIASLDEMADLCNIGTLSAFLIVSLRVIVLRVREPDRPRPFKTPWVPALPILGVAACLYLMFGLPASAWYRFGYWLVIGLAFYAAYGFWHSRVRG